MAKIFISHSSSDKPFAQELHRVLKDIGHDPWIDDRDIQVGEDIVEAVGRAVRDADFLLVVLTPNSVKSRWIQNELNTKYWQEVDSRCIQVIPILKETCELPTLLQSKLYADFSQDFLMGLIPLLKSLNNVKPKVYEDHNTAQTDLMNIFKGNESSGDPKAYFFQYSAVEIRPVLRQAIKSGYRAIVFVQDPERVPISRQHQRIEISLDAIRQIDNNTGNVQVYQVRPPVTAKLVYVPNLFVALSYYIYLDPKAAPRPLNDPDTFPTESEPGQYDVSGHDNPVIIIRAGEEGWKYWSDFAEQLYQRYLPCSRLIHPDQFSKNK
jgi:hypothetical protein